MKITLFCYLLVLSFSCLDSCLHCDSTGTICIDCKDPKLVPMIHGGCLKLSTQIINHCSIYSPNGLCSKC